VSISDVAKTLLESAKDDRVGHIPANLAHPQSISGSRFRQIGCHNQFPMLA
jgi:hypothetical protein